jgi:spore maturation protein CgeB
MRKAVAGRSRRSDSRLVNQELWGCLSGRAIRVCVVRSHGVIGPLVMDGYDRAFRRLGLKTRILDLSAPGGNADSLGKQLANLMAWKPTMAICYGFTGLSVGGLFRSAGVPLALLFYDSPFGIPWEMFQECLKELTAYPDLYHCFLWDRAYLEPCLRMGMRHVYRIMLAADTSVFTPRTPAYRFDVSFAGRMGNTAELRRVRQAAATPRVNDFVDKLIERKVTRPSATLLELWAEVVRESFPDMVLDWGRPGMGELHLHIHREGSALLRRTLLQAIRSVKPDLFGTDWELPGATVHPMIDYVRELPAVYADSRINVNITALQLEYSVNNRIFDVAATGGFLLTDHREDLQQVFPDFARMTYHSGEELDAKIAYFLSHESERSELAAQLQRAVLTGHTYEHRALYLLRSMAANA